MKSGLATSQSWYASGRLPILTAVALFLVALIPLVPRPTFAGAVLVAPTIVLGMAYLLGVQLLSGPGAEAPRPAAPSLFMWILVAATGLYAGRVLWSGSADEYPYMISRILLVIFIVCLTWLCRSAGLERVLTAYAVGFLILAVVVLLIGLTGVAFLEPPRQGRTFGVQIPFYKTPGVPRSYGEQGILLSIGLAALLAYWSRLPTMLRVAGVSATVVILVMGQSRNMLLAGVVVLATWLVVVRPGRWLLMRVTVVLAATATLFVDRLVPFLGSTGIGRALIGEGVFERNISVRFTLFEGAVDLMSSSPAAVFFIGLDHADWSEQKYGWIVEHAVDQEAGVHNHLAASLLFLGFIGGLATLYALYFGPASQIVRRLSGPGAGRACPADEFALLALVGALVVLNFYEGFFSLSVAFVVGVLWSRAAVDRESELPPAHGLAHVRRVAR